MPALRPAERLPALFVGRVQRSMLVRPRGNPAGTACAGAGKSSQPRLHLPPVRGKISDRTKAVGAACAACRPPCSRGNLTGRLVGVAMLLLHGANRVVTGVRNAGCFRNRESLRAGGARHSARAATLPGGVVPGRGSARGEGGLSSNSNFSLVFMRLSLRLLHTDPQTRGTNNRRRPCAQVDRSNPWGWISFRRRHRPIRRPRSR